MKKLCLLALSIVLCCGASAKDYKYSAVEGDPMGVRMYTLNNGLKVYLSVNKEQPRVTAYIAVNTGSKNDPAEYTGLAHYLEHLMFKGSKQFGTTNYTQEKPYIDKITALYEEYRTLTDKEQRKAKYHEIDSVSQIAAQYNIPNEYDKLMALIGSEGSNAYTSWEITCYTEDVPSNELERWAKIQADRFQNLVMRGFHTELEAVYEEKNISLASDQEKAFDAFMLKLFPTHSYGTQTTIGTQEHLKNPSLIAIQNYYNRYYVPNNMAIVMAGDLDFDSTISTIDNYFGDWKPGNDPSGRTFAEQPVFTTPQETFVVGKEQENIMLGWRFKGAADLQNDTLQMMSQVLSNNSAGLIDLNLNQKMLVQEASAATLPLKDYSVFVIGGAPNEGQTLDEVRQLLLGEVEKLKRGEFDDDLLVSIVNNEKLQYLKRLEKNRERVSVIVDAFINGEDWAQHVGQIDRMAKLTKADIVSFANKYLTQGYIYVEKRMGEDTSVKKIEKPVITPIPANRELQSTFLADMAAENVKPIQPEFVDFKKALNFTKTKSNLPVIYVQNKENDLFNLTFMYDFGTEADNRYDIAANYQMLIGTKKLTPEEVQKQFYKLACDYKINVSDDKLTVTLSGLHENMQAALTLLNDVMQNAVADKEVYAQFVDQILKMRQDAKKEQRACFLRLWNYALHGPRNVYTNIMSESELKATAPSTFTDLIKRLNEMEHTVLYYGPASEKELSAIITNAHKTSKKLRAVPQNKAYEWTTTPQTEVFIAPYEAKNIYMRMLNNSNKPWNVSEYPLINVFNEYFGGGMNSIVFQELRETRGLAYNANAFYVTPPKLHNPEYTLMHIISQNDKMMDCINVFKEITDKLPANDAALDIAKQSLMKSIAANRITKYNLITTYLYNKERGIDYDINKPLYEEIPSLTMQDVVNFEQKNIAGKPLHYIILGDEKELDMKALEKVGPVKKLTLEQIFGY